MRLLIAVFIVFWLGFTSCQNRPPRPDFFEGYQRTESGLYYRFHVRSHSGENIHIGDIISAVVTFYWCDDPLNADLEDIFTYLVVDPPLFPGEFSEGLLMMQVGDKASFIMPADSVIKHWGVQRGFLHHLCDYFRVAIQINSIAPPVEMCPTELAIERQRAEEAEAMRADFLIQSSWEQQMLQNHIRENNITVEPNSDGVYVVVVQQGRRGRSARIRDEQVVVFNYTARLLDGTVLDSSCENIAVDAGISVPWRDYQPKEITIGARNWVVGLDNALRGQRVGSRLRLYMPSCAALSPRGELFVSGFQPIILEVEILEVK